MIPRAFPPAPGWSPDGHRIKSEIDYSRGPEKTWIYGALRVRDGQQITMAASSRNSVFYQQFLQQVEDANPVGEIWIATDNLSSHNSLSTRTWLEDHPRIRHAFIPVGACWLNLQEGWWRIFRKTALAGRSFANPDDITHATAVATAQSQRPRTTMGMGKSRTANSPSTTPICVHPMRNPALFRLNSWSPVVGLDARSGPLHPP